MMLFILQEDYGIFEKKSTAHVVTCTVVGVSLPFWNLCYFLIVNLIFLVPKGLRGGVH